MVIFKSTTTLKLMANITDLSMSLTDVLWIIRAQQKEPNLELKRVMYQKKKMQIYSQKKKEKNANEVSQNQYS